MLSGSPWHRRVGRDRQARRTAIEMGRRAAGKPAKLALIAAMRKLLCAIYSVAKNRKPFTVAATVATEQARKA